MNALLPAFNGIVFHAIERDGQPWISSAELARALDYSQPHAVSQIFKRNAAEFTPSMTTMLRRDADTQNECLPGDTRIFSLRGAHLVAMFAKTPVAASFRRWVLDVLDARAGRLDPPPGGPTTMIIDRLAEHLEGQSSVTLPQAAIAAGMADDEAGRKAAGAMLRMLGWRRAWVRNPGAALPARISGASA